MVLAVTSVQVVSPQVLDSKRTGAYDAALRTVILERLAACCETAPSIFEGLARVLLEPEGIEPPTKSDVVSELAKDFCSLRKRFRDIAKLSSTTHDLDAALRIYRDEVEPCVCSIRKLLQRALALADERLYEFVNQARHVLGGHRSDREAHIDPTRIAQDFPTLLDLDRYSENVRSRLNDLRDWLNGRIESLRWIEPVDSTTMCPRRFVAFLAGAGVPSSVDEHIPNFVGTSDSTKLTASLVLKALTDVWHTIIASGILDGRANADRMLVRELGGGFPDISMRCFQKTSCESYATVVFSLRLSSDWLNDGGQGNTGLLLSAAKAHELALGSALRKFGVVLKRIELIKDQTQVPEEESFTGLEVEVHYPVEKSGAVAALGLAIEKQRLLRLIEVARSIHPIASAEDTYLLQLPSIQDTAVRGLASRRAFLNESTVQPVKAAWKCVSSTVGVKDALFYFDEYGQHNAQGEVIVLLNPKLPRWLTGTSKSQAALEVMATGESSATRCPIPADVVLTPEQAGSCDVMSNVDALLTIGELCVDLRCFSRASDRLRTWVGCLKAELQRLCEKFGPADTPWRIVLEHTSEAVTVASSLGIPFILQHKDVQIPIQAIFDRETGVVTVLDGTVEKHCLPPGIVEKVVHSFYSASEGFEAGLNNVAFDKALESANIYLKPPLRDQIARSYVVKREKNVHAQRVRGILVGYLERGELLWRKTEDGIECRTK